MLIPVEYVVHYTSNAGRRSENYKKDVICFEQNSFTEVHGVVPKSGTTFHDVHRLSCKIGGRIY